jgi:hypothetical protein
MARDAADMPSPDGSLVYRQAMKAEVQALRKYCDVLRVFTDLVVQGKLPPDRDQ